jgi:hypothetical protein
MNRSNNRKQNRYCNGFDENIARQQLGKHVPTQRHATIEEALFSISFLPRGYRRIREWEFTSVVGRR